MAGGLSGLVAALAGCGRLGPSEKERLNSEVEAVSGVTSSDIGRTGGGGLRTGLSGDIHFDAGEDELLDALDPAWRVVTEYVFEMDEGEGNREVHVTANGSDGSTLAPKALLGPEYADQVERVTFGHFFEHYGLS
ncbi:hypothetical protein M4D54_07065 [Brachybacterium sp. p3-SID1565]|uniref:hypothetical protein n=1 Tax=unclassified Brachybacterium TaxID=2623841 RepID=UPI001FA1E675|nr:MULTISPECIES: hypothetical protein [unclassified Brachybacterium]MCT1385387.1 hypothetical protein [Brachybacterium sp. p3-SID1565]MCT1776167.1 hypothetical protein [Brachybacterium sp. p3-SID957]HIY24338.1 hypothetical protein [Candidatus Brachybacterium merdigallinarum]